MASETEALTDFQHEIVQRNIDLTNMVLALRHGIEVLHDPMFWNIGMKDHRLGDGPDRCSACSAWNDTAAAVDTIKADIEKPWREALRSVAWNENDGLCWCRESPDDGPGRVKPHEERCLAIRSLSSPTAEGD